MTTPREKAFEMHRKVQELRHRVLEYNQDVDDSFKDMTKHTKVDVCFFYREIEDALDDLRKECLARREKIAQGLGEELIREAIASGTADTACVGTFATAYADIKTLPIMPKRGSVEYKNLILAMGVAPEIVDAGVVEPHFVRLGEFLTTKAGAGLTPFKDFLQTREQVVVSYRRKK